MDGVETEPHPFLILILGDVCLCVCVCVVSLKLRPLCLQGKKPGRPALSQVTVPTPLPVLFLALLMYSFIHSFSSLPDDRSIACPKVSSPQMRSNASSLNLQYLLFSLRSSGSCLFLLPRLPLPSILSSIFP